MKTYEQVVNQAALFGLASFYGGSSEYAGAHAFVDAAKFIYDVDRDKFINDVERVMNVARKVTETSDKAIKWLELKAEMLEKDRLRHLAEQSWQGSVDRQGGSFDDWEKMDRGWN